MQKGINVNDVRQGMTLIYRDKLHEVEEFAHTKPGKGPAFVRLKLRNFETGNAFEETFNTSTKFMQAIVEKKDMEYIYREGDKLMLMDNETFEQVPCEASVIGDPVQFLKENTKLVVTIYDNSVIRAQMPDHMNFKVVSAEEAVRGNTAGNVTKEVEIETGAKIRVPQFIKLGNTIRVDTRTGQYLERVND